MGGALAKRSIPSLTAATIARDHSQALGSRSVRGSSAAKCWGQPIDLDPFGTTINQGAFCTTIVEKGLRSRNFFQADPVCKPPFCQPTQSRSMVFKVCPQTSGGPSNTTNMPRYPDPDQLMLRRRHFNN